MPKITRIKAKDDVKTTKQSTNKSTAKLVKKDQKSLKKTNKKADKATKKPAPKFLRILAAPFVFISKPFRPFGRYVKAAWQEIRQVRWPDRKTTWKMTLSVIIYVIIFAAVIMLLDALFAFIFNKLLGV